MAKPKVGETYRFAFDIGTDPGRIPAGTVVTVEEVVSADTPGAGDSENESYVVVWEEKQAILDGDEARVETVQRRWAANDEAFTGLLEKG